MSFIVRIAATPPPGVRRADIPERVDAATAATVTLAASGLMDDAGVEEILAETRRLFAEGADTVVLDVGELSFASDDVRTRFGEAVRSERALTHHVFVRSHAETVHGELKTCEEAATWLMPLEGTTGELPRRSITARTPLQP